MIHFYSASVNLFSPNWVELREYLESVVPVALYEILLLLLASLSIYYDESEFKRHTIA